MRFVWSVFEETSNETSTTFNENMVCFYTFEVFRSLAIIILKAKFNSCFTISPRHVIKLRILARPPPQAPWAGSQFQEKTLARLTQTGKGFSWNWRALIRGIR